MTRTHLSIALAVVLVVALVGLVGFVSAETNANTASTVVHDVGEMVGPMGDHTPGEHMGNHTPGEHMGDSEQRGGNCH